MTEDTAPAELEEVEAEQPQEAVPEWDEAEQPQKAVADEDSELYSIITPSSPTSAFSAARGKEVDESSLHEIDFMHDVPLSVSVVIGETRLSVREILALSAGKVVEFTKVVGEPMDINISGRLMARGEVVVVNERYGVRISEVTRPDETEIAAKESGGI